MFNGAVTGYQNLRLLLWLGSVNGRSEYLVLFWVFGCFWILGHFRGSLSVIGFVCLSDHLCLGWVTFGVWVTPDNCATLFEKFCMALNAFSFGRIVLH